MFKDYGELSTLLYEHTKSPGQAIGGDIPYYFDKLADVKGAILEAGVGTGRMLIPLLQKGFSVDGVDISPDMLAKCKANLNERGLAANLYQQDLTKLDLPQKYSVIIMPTGSFCLLPREIVKDALSAFFSHLEVGGKLIVDIIFPSEFKQGETFSQIYPFDDGTGILYTNFHREIDWVNQKTSHVIRYELLRDGEIQQSELSNFTLHWYGIWEMQMMLKTAGFADISHEFGYGKPGQSSPTPITFVATKR